MEPKYFCLRLKGLHLPTFSTKWSSYAIVFDTGGNLVMTRRAKESKLLPPLLTPYSAPPAAAKISAIAFGFCIQGASKYFIHLPTTGVRDG